MKNKREKQKNFVPPLSLYLSLNPTQVYSQGIA